MKKIKEFISVLILLVFTGLTYSQSSELSIDKEIELKKEFPAELHADLNPDHADNNFLKSELTDKLLNQDSKNYSDLKNFKNFERNLNLESATKSDEKSPYLGALFSGVIPGSGEFYAKSYIKAAIFFAIEIGLWTAYGVYEGNGNEQTDYYKGVADKNWSVNKYAQWLVDQQFTGFGSITDPQSQDLNTLRRQINIVEAQNFSHQLPPYGDQQYYELIGKYQNFVVGWADADPNISKNSASPNYYGTYKTEMFNTYAVDRQTANDYYNKANTSLALVLLNHLVSAADAAWSVTMFNKDLKVNTNMKFKNMYGYYGESKLVPFANLNVTF
ncbi:MAG TPA: hypothetical protein PLX80_05850 [Ignavibacteria bacterium]|nr:hypothetical protein [Ignavibacteria bacterium]